MSENSKKIIFHVCATWLSILFCWKREKLANFSSSFVFVFCQFSKQLERTIRGYHNVSKLLKITSNVFQSSSNRALECWRTWPQMRHFWGFFNLCVQKLLLQKCTFRSTLIFSFPFSRTQELATRKWHWSEASAEEMGLARTSIQAHLKSINSLWLCCLE